MWKSVLIFYVVWCRQCSSKVVKINESLYEDNGLLIRKMNKTPILFDEARIVGGEETNIQNFPFAAQIQFGNHFICGGTIITVNDVLTAAHCVSDTESNEIIPAGAYLVRVGTTRIVQGGILRGVRAILRHRQFDGRKNLDYDIALMKLHKRLVLGKSVSKAKIPKAGFELHPRSAVTAVGWGKIHPVHPGFVEKTFKRTGKPVKGILCISTGSYT